MLYLLARTLLLFSLLLQSPLVKSDTSDLNADCTFNLNDTSGSFSTPNFPGIYPNLKVCGWIIVAPENSADISVTFEEFELEPSKRCVDYDYVKLYRKSLGQTNWESYGFPEGYCGTLSRFTVSDTTHMFLVNFKSDKSEGFKGFNATYEVKITQARPRIKCLGRNGDTVKCNRTIVTKEGDVTMVSCNAESIPPPTFQWFQKTKNNTYAALQEEYIKHRFSNGSIQLHNFKIEDTGTYACRATNKLGSDMQDFELIIQEKCKCPKEITTNWYDYAPYTRYAKRDSKGNLQYKGIFYTIVTKMVASCCGNCSGGHGKSTIMWGEEADARKLDLSKVKANIETDNYDLSFPIGGAKHDVKYRQSYRFVPVVDSPGVAFTVYRKEGSQSQAIFNSILEGWPILVLTVVMAVLAGIIMWALDTHWNKTQFPPSFTEGVVEGFWWAFVTMTTVGYGDIAPVGVPGRIFAIIWVLTGLIIISIFTGVITTSLTVVTLETDVKLYDAKLGAINNTAEYRLGIIKNAKMTGYLSFESMREAMVNGDVRGVLVDAYVSAHQKKALGDSSSFRVNKIISTTSAYGFVLGPRMSEESLHKCFTMYLQQKAQEVTQDIEDNTSTLEEPKVSAAEENSSGLFDAQSELFKTAVIVSTVLLIVFSLGGILFEYGYLRPRQKMIEAAKNLEMVESEEVKAMARRAQLLKETLLHEVQEFYDRWTKNITGMRARHKEEQKKLFEKGPNPSKPHQAEEAMEMEKPKTSPRGSAITAFGDGPVNKGESS